MNDDVLIRAEHVSKKFCRSLKRSLWYGAKDVGRSLLPWGAPVKTDHEGISGEFRLPLLRQDEFWAIRDVSFELRRGECLGLIGHNGAGKSTLLKMLNSLNRPDAGSITMRGRIGALIELSAGFNPILTGRENIYNQASLLGFSRQETDEKFDAIVDFSELEEFLDMPLQNYSSGMRVKLGFAVSSQLEPDILLVDEVLAVGDVGFRLKCINKMTEMMKKCAVIFVSHSMPQIFRVCNQIMLLQNGMTVYQGKDVPSGVSKYFNMFNSEKISISGSGEAKIKSFMLESGDETKTRGDDIIVNYGDKLCLNFCLEIMKDIKNVKLDILIWSIDMVPVLQLCCEKMPGYRFDNKYTGDISITANIQKIMLNDGKYTITGIISDEKVLCRYDNLGSIVVKSGFSSGAYAHSMADWDVKYG